LKISFSGIFWGLICIGIGFFFLAGTWGAYLEYNRIQEYSGRASGHVTKKHFQTAADGSGNYYLDYWFVPSVGSKINATGGISKPQWDTLKVNDNLEIRYDPSNPNRNIPLYGGSPSLVLAFFMLVLGFVFLVFGALRFIASFKKGRK
jgi:Protein of unknown function (DUF3592)